MNKKLVFTMSICAALTASSLGYFGLELYKYNSKLKQLNDIRLDIVEMQELIIENYELINSEHESIIKEKENEILSIMDENSKYIECIDELNSVIDKITAESYFNDQDITKPSKATATHLKKALKDTALYDLVDAYIEAESIHGVNAYALVAITALESDWGTSNRSINDNNLTGFAVYSNSSKGRVFGSKRECILETARLLKEDYLTPCGKSYSGLSLKDVNTRYCFTQDGTGPDYTWSTKVSLIAKDLKNKANLGVRL